MKKISLLIIIILIYGCGYSPLYLNGKNDLFLNLVNIKGDFDLNNYIKNDLKIASDENSLNVFDINGRLVQTLNRSKLRAGNYSFDWEGTDQFGTKVTSGVYFIRIDAGSFKSIKKTLLVK